MEKRPIESCDNTVSKKCRRETPIPDETTVENDSLPSTSDSIPSDFLLEDDIVSKLPFEVVNHIFQFLPLRDRRNASLACSKWHEVGGLREYSVNEKLVFCGYEDFERALLLLSETRREFLNLEFHGCRFRDSSNLLSISEKIRSLSLTDCKLSDDFLSQLFIQCNHLKEFHCVPVPDDSCCILEFIRPLAQKGFINENLETLIMNLDGSLFEVENERVESLFNMFPNLKNMPKFELRWWVSPDEFSFSVAQRMISKKHTLETLDTVGYENHLQLLESHNFPRLKKLSFLLGRDIVPDLSYFNFFIRLEFLEKLSVHILKYEHCDNPDIVLASHIVHLITRCSSLKHLKLLSDDDGTLFNFNPEIFQALVSSNLISFELDDEFSFTYSEIDNYDQSLENRTLRVLRIKNVVRPPVPILFLQHFKNLEVLELNDCYSETVLESIGQLQTNLTQLKFKCPLSNQIDEICQGDTSQVLDCLHSLSRLESLDLSLANENLLLNCGLIPPCVKYLRLSLPTSPKFGSDVLKKSVLPLKNKKGLEAIYFESKCICMTDLSIWLDICSSLKNLHILCLQFVGFQPSTARKIHAWFSETQKKFLECCPSLRCLVLKTGCEITLFFYDPVDRKMKAARNVNPEMMDDVIFVEVIAGLKIKLDFPPKF